jgi:hypothetical protein
MTYDDWKLESPEDEHWRVHGKQWCEDCDNARATNCYVTSHSGPYHHEYWLCEPCCEKRDEEEAKRLAQEAEDDQ